MQKAVEADQAVITPDLKPEYVDNVVEVQHEETVNQIKESVGTKVPDMTVENKQEEINFDDFDPMAM